MNCKCSLDSVNQSISLINLVQSSEFTDRPTLANWRGGDGYPAVGAVLEGDDLHAGVPVLLTVHGAAGYQEQGKLALKGSAACISLLMSFLPVHGDRHAKHTAELIIRVGHLQLF